ncbi:recombinase family protein [Streptomyces sp. NPDC012693]|uniref:recombinase family protein n=1 Tax=Streptomyces sp. NPDC012693 TaxID=3364844 RepID=UPI00367AE2EC
MSSLFVPKQGHGRPPDDLPWVGYIRVSTWKEELISPELQESAIRQWAARTGRRLAEPMVIDLDATGRNFKRKILRCIERVEQREAQGIAVWRYSRFGRNRTGTAANLARLEAVGGELESATEDVDVTTALGELQREMIFAFGNYESNRAGEQWREAHEYRLKNQLPATGRPRFGYVWHPRRVPDATVPGGWRLQDERYTLHPDFAPIVEEMYDRKVATPVPQGFTQIAHWLNDELGIPSMTGGLWYTNNIRRFLDAGFAAGLIRAHDRACRCGYGKNPEMGKCAADRMLFLPGAQPKIIGPDRWEEYKEHRARTKSTPARARVATYTLSGIGSHGRCRAHLSHASYSTDKKEQIRGYWLVCGLRKSAGKSACDGINVRRKQVEDAVRDWIRDDFAEEVDALPSEERGAAPREAPEAAVMRKRGKLTAELKRTDAAMDRLVMDNAMDPEKYPADAYARVRNQLAADKAKLIAQLDALGKAEATPPKEQFKSLLVGLVDEWDSFLPIERNAMLRQAVRRVACYDTRDADGVLISVRTEVHPVWLPDPWKPTTICLAHVQPRPDWSPGDLWARSATDAADVIPLH